MLAYKLIHWDLLKHILVPCPWQVFDPSDILLLVSLVVEAVARFFSCLLSRCGGVGLLGHVRRVLNAVLVHGLLTLLLVGKVRLVACLSILPVLVGYTAVALLLL